MAQRVGNETMRGRPAAAGAEQTFPPLLSRRGGPCARPEDGHGARLRPGSTRGGTKGQKTLRLHPGCLETSGSSQGSETSRTPRSGQPAQPPMMPSSAPRVQGQEQRDRHSQTQPRPWAHKEPRVGSGALFPFGSQQTHAVEHSRARRAGTVVPSPDPGLGRGSQDSSARPHSRVLRSWPVPLPGPSLHSAQDGLSGEHPPV